MRKFLILVLIFFAGTLGANGRQWPSPTCWSSPAQFIRQGGFAWYYSGCDGNAGADVQAIETAFDAVTTPPPESAGLERTELVTHAVVNGQEREVRTKRGQQERRGRFERRHWQVVREWR